MVDNKKISLCMVVFNNADGAKRAVESVKSLIDEVVIVDQGSDVEESKKLRDLADVYVLTTNKGNADYDRNFCYSFASGEFILALDADEYLEEIEVSKTESAIKRYNPDLLWFIFQNTISYQRITVDLKKFMGDDPHPRLWRKFLFNGPNPTPTVLWPEEAHQFPQINTPKQVFAQIFIKHDRELLNVVNTHIHRGKNISEMAKVTERNFIKRVFDEFGSDIRKQCELHIPELTEYLKD